MAEQSLSGVNRSRHRKGPIGWFGALRRWFIRMRAYFLKELNELRRQPMLILSLVGGPLLVLILFGASFTSSNPNVRTVIVLPPGGAGLITEQQIRELVGLNFQIQQITEDQATAERLLQSGQIDLVQIVPANAAETLQQGQSPEIVFRSNAINPLVEGWIQYLAYAEVNEINKAILREQAKIAQQEAATIQVRISDARVKIGTVDQNLAPDQIAETQQSLRDLRMLLNELERLIPVVNTLEGSEEAKLREDITRTRNSIDTLDKAITDGTIAEHTQDLKLMESDLIRVEGMIDVFIKTPPEVVIAPIKQRYENMRGKAYEAVVFYAPGVLALLVQHTAITLGALALVRERLMGAFEVFRVTPANMVQLLLGKYLSYTLFITSATAVLIAAMAFLGVPFYGGIGLFAGVVVLLTLASLGVGFLISAISGSDSQAIQLAMLALLLSIFFSGFFISLDSFLPISRFISEIIPMTHGVIGFQEMLLRGLPPNPYVWLALTLISVITFVMVVLLTRRQLSRA